MYRNYFLEERNYFLEERNYFLEERNYFLEERNYFLEERTYANFVYKSDQGHPDNPTTLYRVVISLREI